MSVNTAHASNGVLIHAGEYILLHSDSISMEFSGQDNSIFRGSKGGRIYLTSHRMIFNNKKSSDVMQSFSAPFVALSDVEIEQPVFGANYIKGKVRAQPNGNYIGEVKFKLYFKAGGAIEYGQALLRAAKTAMSNFHRGGLAGDDPPPYMPPGAWHEAPPPAYQPPPGYYGWLPQHDAFSGPAPNTVFIGDSPPPYPGIVPPSQPPQPAPPPQTTNAPTWYGFSAPDEQPQPQQQGWGGGVPGYTQPPPYGAATAGGPGGYNQPGAGYGQPGAGYGQPGAGYGQPGAGYNLPPSCYGQPGYGQPAYGQPNCNGYGQPGGGYPAPGAPGAPAESVQPGGFATPGYFPPTAPNQQQQQQHQAQGQQHPPPGGAAGGAAAGASWMGFSLPPNSKEAEAMASAYHNTPYNQQHGNYGNGGGAGPNSDLPPPSYDDLPPSYKKSQ